MADQLQRAEAQSPSKQRPDAALKTSQPAAAVDGGLSMQTAVASPGDATPGQILKLQRHFGNRAVARLMRAPAAPVGYAGGELSDAMARQVQSERGGGSRIDAAVGETVGRALGADLSGVRVHTDARSDALNRSMSAHAFTLGNDIFFSAGAYNPGSSGGRRLLAHELTHVVQQGGARASGPQTKLTVGAADDAYEREADQVAQAVVTGHAHAAERPGPQSVRRALSVTIRRWPFGKKKKEPEISGPTDVKLNFAPIKNEQDINNNLGNLGYTQPMIEAGPTNSISRPDPTTVKRGQEVFNQPNNNDPRLQEPSSEKVVLKPGESGEETMRHSTTPYLDLLGDYVKRGGVNQGTINLISGQMNQDYGDVVEGHQSHTQIAQSLQIADEKVRNDENNKSVGFFQKRKNKKERDDLAKAKKGLESALGEPDFGKAEEDAKTRAEDSQRAQMEVTVEQATIEHLYDEVRDAKKDEREWFGGFSRSQKKGEAYKESLQKTKGKNADLGRRNAQQAKMSFDVIKVKRKQAELRKERLAGLGRLAGPLRKILGTIAGGVLGAVLNILTVGALNLKSNVGEKGFQGKGLEKKGYPFKVTFFNDIRHQLTQFRTTLKVRPKGPKAIDYVSAILRGFNEIVLQNVVKIAGNIALITGIAATIVAVASLGTATPAAVVLATISTIAAIVSLIAAAAKVAVDLLRVIIDGLTALLNSDAKKSNALKARFRQAGFETLGDTLQAAGTATGTGTAGLIKTGHFLNAFDPSQMVGFNVGQLTATNSLGTTVGALSANLGQSVAAPLIGGPVTQGVAGVVSKPLGYQMMHPDERTEGTSGISHLRSGSQMPNRPGGLNVGGGMPDWMQNEGRKQDELRQAAYKSRQKQALSQMTVVIDKANELGGKLGEGSQESSKMDSQVRGKGEGEDSEMSQGQTSTLASLSTTSVELGGSLSHSKGEIEQINKIDND